MLANLYISSFWNDMKLAIQKRGQSLYRSPNLPKNVVKIKSRQNKKSQKATLKKSRKSEKSKKKCKNFLKNNIQKKCGFHIIVYFLLRFSTGVTMRGGYGGYPTFVIAPFKSRPWKIAGLNPTPENISPKGFPDFIICVI